MVLILALANRHSNEVFSVTCEVKISLSFAGGFMASGSLGRDFQL